MRAIGLILLVLAILGLGCAWKVYEFRDCRRVGHSTFYCVMKWGGR